MKMQGRKSSSISHFAIRKAQPPDLTQIKILLAELAEREMTEEEMAERFQMIITSSHEELYVYEQEENILGILGFRIRENLEEPSRYGEVSVLVTARASRHKGVGKALMRFAEKLAKEKNCKGTWLVSGFGREQKAHKFYAKLGYQVTGYRFVKLF